MSKSTYNRFINQRLGALPSGWNDKSLLYQVDRPTIEQVELLPDTCVELKDYIPDNFGQDQGNVGTCVGWDFSACIETQATLMALDPTIADTLFTLSLTDLSAGWTYQFSREYSIPPVPANVEGSTNYGACRALLKVGTALERDFPTDITSPFDFKTPNQDTISRAQKYRISSYHNVPADPTSIKAAIYGLTHPLPYLMPDRSAGKSPLASAFPVYENFYESFNNGGVVPMPAGRLLGGHSSMIYGWNVIDGKRYFANFGSWGKDKGDKGVFYIPEQYPFYPNDWFLMMIVPGVEPVQVTNIIETTHWAKGLINALFANDVFRYYYGREVS